MRNVLAKAAAALGLILLVPVAAAAQDWPQKPIKMIVPFPAGGGTDFIARLAARHLTNRLGQQVFVENRGGANGAIGLQALMASDPDGYTIATTSDSPMVVNPWLYDKLAYAPLRDFLPVATMVRFPGMLAVHPSVPVVTVAELISLAKAKPGQLNVPVGLGSNIHMSTLEMQQRLGVKWVYVPTKGGQSSVLSVMTGDGDFLFMGVIQTWVHVKAGRLKLLAVSSEQREPMFSEVPTVAETPGLQGYSAGSWQGILGPAKLPPEIVNKLYNEVKRIVAMPDFSEKLTAQGSRPQAKTPQEVGSWLATEKERWAKVVKESGYKIE